MVSSPWDIARETTYKSQSVKQVAWSVASFGAFFFVSVVQKIVVSKSGKLCRLRARNTKRKKSTNNQSMSEAATFYNSNLCELRLGLS
jgi:hypothetical protein